MKKIILILVLIILISNNIRGQIDSTNLRYKLRFGLKAGVNLSNVYDTKGESFDANTRFGLSAGAFFVIPISKIIGIQHEMLFSQKGFQE